LITIRIARTDLDQAGSSAGTQHFTTPAASVKSKSGVTLAFDETWRRKEG